MIVTVVFKLINFFIIVIGSWIGFRLFFKPQVTERIQEKELFIADLQEKTVVLRCEHHVLDERILHDKQYAEVLNKKIEAWLHALQEKKHAEELREEGIRQKIVHKHTLQQDYIYKQEMYKHIIPAALKEVQEELQQKYASAEKQDAFMHAIVQTMKHG